MNPPKLLDLLRAKQAEREYSQTPPVPPADGLQRRGVFIAPTKETMKAYRSYFFAKAEGGSTPKINADN